MNATALPSMYVTPSGVLVVWTAHDIAKTTPTLQANVVLRLVVCPLVLAAAWVPLQLLWKTGELAACVFLVINALRTLMVLVNAAVWHDQDLAGWWLGFGWCDLQSYVQFAMTTIFSACVCAVMRRLAQQLAVSRVSAAELQSRRERRVRLLAQLLIIVPVPLLQVALTIFVTASRYALVPVAGCSSYYSATWVFLVFFALPSPLFTAAACFYAFQTYHRFKKLDAVTRPIHNSLNSTITQRSNRTRRRLYLMVLSILMPYAPMEAVFFAITLREGWPWTESASFRRVHNTSSPFNALAAGQLPWNSIPLQSYGQTSFVDLNMSWISVVSVFLVFVFFGTSKEAANIYRKYLIALGLGLFCRRPPNNGVNPENSCTSRVTVSSTASTAPLRSPKASLAPTQRCLSVDSSFSDPFPSPYATASTSAQSERQLGSWASKMHGFFVRPQPAGASDAAAQPFADQLELGHQPSQWQQQQQQQHYHQQNQCQLATASSSATLNTGVFNPGLSWFTPPKALLWAFSVPSKASSSFSAPRPEATTAASATAAAGAASSLVTTTGTCIGAGTGTGIDTAAASGLSQSRPMPIALAPAPSACRPSTPLSRQCSVLESGLALGGLETEGAGESGATLFGTDGVNTHEARISTRVWSDSDQPQDQRTHGGRADARHIGVCVDRCITSSVI